MNSQPAKTSAFADDCNWNPVGEGRRFRWLRTHSLELQKAGGSKFSIHAS